MVYISFGSYVLAGASGRRSFDFKYVTLEQATLLQCPPLLAHGPNSLGRQDRQWTRLLFSCIGAGDGLTLGQEAPVKHSENWPNVKS